MGSLIHSFVHLIVCSVTICTEQEVEAPNLSYSKQDWIFSAQIIPQRRPFVGFPKHLSSFSKALEFPKLLSFPPRTWTALEQCCLQGPLLGAWRARDLGQQGPRALTMGAACLGIVSGCPSKVGNILATKEGREDWISLDLENWRNYEEKISWKKEDRGEFA